MLTIREDQLHRIMDLNHNADYSTGRLIWTFDDYEVYANDFDDDLVDDVGEPQRPISAEDYAALQTCDLFDIVSSQSMSDERLGGDDVLEYISDTIRAKDAGYHIHLWYGSDCETLAIGYRPEQLTITPAPDQRWTRTRRCGRDDADEDNDQN